MTEPQVWVLIGVFSAAIFGMLSWQTISFHRALKTEIGALRQVVEVRLDHLDRDVQALTRHIYGGDPAD